MKKCQMSNAKCQMSNASLKRVFFTVQTLISLIPPISLISSQQGFIKITKRALVSYLIAKQNITSNKKTLQAGFLKITKRLIVSYLIISIVFFGTGLIYLFNPFGTGSVDAAWFNDDWAYRKAITIDESMVSGSSNLTNFPVLVSLASDTALADKAQDDGDDIVFTAINGDRLSHEIEKFDGSTGELVAWVRVPSLSATSNTILYIYFGNPGVSNQQRPTDVWEASYQVVQHMEETSTSDTTNTDSTSNKNDAIKETANRPTPATGQIAGSQDKSVSALGNDWYINNAAPPSGTQDYTISFWVDPNNAGNYNAIHWGNNGSDVATFAILLVATTGRPRLAYNQSTVLNATTDMNGAGYYHVVLTRSGNTHTFYVNGAAAGTASSSTSLTFSGNCPMHLANSWSSSDCVNNANTTNSMALDEFKYALGTAKSADWIATEYNNQSNPGSYITTGSEEKGPSPIAYWRFDEGQGTNSEDSTVNNKDVTLAASTSTPAWQTEDQCIAEKCLYFDGSNDYASATPAIPTGDFTYSAWVYSLDNSDDMVFMASDGSTSNEFGVHLASTKVRINIDNVSVMNTTNVFPMNTWTHLAVTRSGSTVTVYVNGNADPTTGSSATTMNFSSCELLIGVDADSGCNGSLGNHFKGKIDEIKVYNQALSASQIKSNFNARSSLDVVASQNGNNIQNLPGTLSNGLVGYWKMDETTAGSSRTDSSGNSNTLTDHATVGLTTGKFANSGQFTAASSQWLDISDNASLSTGNNDFTISAWVYMDAAGTGKTIASKWATGMTNSEYQLWVGGDNLAKLTWGNGSTSTNVASSTALSANTWYFVTAYHKAITNEIGISVNNSSFNTASITGGVDGTANFLVGAMNFGTANNPTASSFWDGRIDELRVYNRALSPAEVSQLYNWAPGPVGYWKLDERTGGSAYDASGYANNGTLGSTTATPSWANGKYGSALSYDGGDTVSVSDSSSLSLTGNFSLAAWVNVPNLSGFKPAVTKENSGQTGYFLYISDDEVYTGYGNGAWRSQTTSTSPITANTWIHIASTFDGTTLTTYVNGVSVQSSAPGGSVSDNSSDLGIGNASDLSSMYTGLIDEAKVYNYPRTAEQIKADMNAGHPAPGSPVSSAVAHWKLDEGYGTSAQDFSGNTNTLTLSSATSAWTNSGKFNKAWNGDGALYMSRADDSDFDVSATDDYSVSLWYKSDSASNPGATEYLFNKASATIAGYAIYANTSGNLCFAIDDDTTWSPDVASCTTTDVYDATWHHIVAVRDVTQDKTYIYLDGNVADSDTDSTSATLANSLLLYVGDRDGTNNGDEFNGDLDEIKAYRLALTAEQVKIDMNRSSSQVLGAVGTSSNQQPQSAANEYCPPDSSASSCTGPVLEYKLDEGSGTTANDSTGNANTGTITAGTGGFMNGKINKAYNFDGADSVINGGSGTTLDDMSGISLEAWIYPRSTGEGSNAFLINKNLSNTQSAGWIWHYTSNRGLLFVADGSTDIVRQSSNSLIPLNQWSHVAMTWGGNMASASTVRFFINGVETSYQTTTNGASRVSDAARSIYIGNASSSDRTFDGLMDQVRVFNYERTTAQVAWSYNKGGPVAWWKMDECQGTSIYDASGNGYTGTLTADSAGTCTTSGSWFNGVTGKRNYSMDFDGVDDDITISSNLILPTSATEVTLAAWVNLDSRDTSGAEIISLGDIVSIRADDTTGGRETTGFFYAGSSTWHATSSQVNIAGDGWRHVVYTYKSGTQRIYIDGIPYATTTQTGLTWTGQGSSTKIGEHGNGNVNYNLNGRIDDARVYSYYLTETQVKNLYNEGATRFGPATGAP